MNTSWPVPNTPATVTAAYEGAAAEADRQCAVVPEVQDVVEHVPDPSTTVGDALVAEKLRPAMVTLTADVNALLGRADEDTTGAAVETNTMFSCHRAAAYRQWSRMPSNVKAVVPVPTTLLTVTGAYDTVLEVAPRHSTVVEDVHADVAHTADPAQRWATGWQPQS